MPITEAPNSPPPTRNTSPENGSEPPRPQPPLPPLPSNSGYNDLGTDELVQRINDLEDERRAARIREGIWIALLLHAIVVLLWVFGPRYILHEPQLVNPSAKEKKNLSYLDLPPDALHPVQPRHTQVLSDKNRVQTAPHPSLDKKTLEQLQAMRRAAPPAPQQTTPQQTTPQPAPQTPVPAPQQQQPPPQPTQQAQHQAPPTPTPAPQPKQQAQQQAPANPFKTPNSAGDMIRQAARAAAGSSGSSGDYGANAPSSHGGNVGGVDILSDTLGYDFSAYLKSVVAATYRSWIMPESARPPLLDKGIVQIEFVIGKDGTVHSMRLRGPSGEVALDRAAWAAITGGNYPPLPTDFKGPNLALRFAFYYNIHPGDEK